MTPQEFIDKHYAAPDLDVIDHAIGSLRSGRAAYSCNALSCAVACAVWGYLDASCHVWGQREKAVAYTAVSRLYREQYKEVVRHHNAGRLPKFWDGAGTPKNLAARIRALQDFRAACIAAANQE